MKNSIRRVCAAGLAVLMLIGMAAAVSSCANTGGGDVTTAGQAESTVPAIAETTTLKPNLPDVKYNTIFDIASGFVTDTKYTCTDIAVYEMDGDIINDAIFRRTSLVEELLGIDIVVNDVNYTTINNSVTAGDGTYDIGTATLSEIMKIVNNRSAINLYDCPSIDTEKPWWDQNAIDKLCIGDKLFYTFSDFLITALDNSRAVYFNKQLATDLEMGDVYSLVDNNEWTIEKMQAMAEAAMSDLDGNGVYIANDRLGIVNNATTFYEVMLTGCNAEIMKQGDNGIPYFCCIDERDYFVDVVNKLLDLFSGNKGYLITDTATGRTMFMNGQSLFTCDTLYYASKMRLESTNLNFGIMPVPKYSADQEKYLHVSPNPDAFFIIPASDDIIEQNGVILEALSYYSSSFYADDALIPSYFDLALSYRSAKDVESSQMLQIVHDNISYVIKIIGTDFSNSIYNNCFATGSRNITTIIDSSKKAITRSLDKVLEDLDISR